MTPEPLIRLFTFEEDTSKKTGVLEPLFSGAELVSQGSNVRTSHRPTLSAPCEPKKVSLSASFGVT